MRRIATAAGLVLALLVTPAAAQESGFDEALAGFRKIHRAEVRRAGIVGSSFYVVRDGRTVAADHLGEQDAEAHVPVDAQTIYHWASITKTMTGIAIMQLRDRGLLKLDDPIVRYVPELARVHNPFGDAGAITLRQLMSHSAGFRSGTWPWRDKEWQPFEPPGWKQLEAMLPYTEVQFRPGSRFSYSNPGIVYLGQVIERLSGEDFEVYIDKNILRPLGMHASYFDRTPLFLLPHRSHSYYLRGGKRSAAPFDADTGVTVSNGGLNAPMPDMAKYLAFLLGDPGRAAGYDLILKRASLEEMWRPQISAGEDFTQGRMAATTQSGLSFFVDQGKGFRIIGHNGDQNGFRAYLSFCPDQRIGSLLAFNTETRGVETNPSNRTTAESRIALATDRLCEAVAGARWFALGLEPAVARREGLEQIEPHMALAVAAEQRDAVPALLADHQLRRDARCLQRSEHREAVRGLDRLVVGHVADKGRRHRRRHVALERPFAGERFGGVGAEQLAPRLIVRDRRQHRDDREEHAGGDRPRRKTIGSVDRRIDFAIRPRAQLPDEMAARREADRGDPRRIDRPLRRAGADQPYRALGVLQRRGRPRTPTVARQTIEQFERRDPPSREHPGDPRRPPPHRDTGIAAARDEQHRRSVGGRRPCHRHRRSADMRPGDVVGVAARRAQHGLVADAQTLPARRHPRP